MGSCSRNQSGFLNYFEENKLLSCITSFTFVVIFIFIYILRQYTFFDKRRVPRAARPSAPFGNIQDVLFQETTLYEFLWKYYNRFKRKGFKYGGLYLFFKPSYLIINPALMQKITSEEKCVNVWHRKRLGTDGFLNPDLLENLFNQYHVIKESLIEDLNDRAVSMSTAMHNFFMETTCSAFGFRTNFEFLEIINLLLNRKRNPSFKYYFGLVYPLFGRKSYIPKMEDQIQNVINYRKKNDVRENDVMQWFIDLFNERDYNLKRSDVEEIFNIFVDNIIHSYSSLLFCLYELARNNSIQQDLIKEIRSFYLENRSIRLKDMEQLSYLDAVVKETFRKYPPIPTIIKKCEQDVKIDEFNLELSKGTFILYSIMGVHRDPTNYSEPEKFDPKRFFEGNTVFDTSNTYVPFGLDAWKEIGLRFTSIHIKLGLISIFSTYNVSLKGADLLEFDNKRLPIYPKEPLPITFERLLK